MFLALVLVIHCPCICNSTTGAGRTGASSTSARSTGASSTSSRSGGASSTIARSAGAESNVLLAPVLVELCI